MGTRSYIGRKLEDGTIQAVYCHWDGYPDHNGRILASSYNNVSKVDELISLGDLSSLGEEIGEKHEFFHAPKGICTFYGRDRGEERTGPRTYNTQEDFMKSASDSWAEYVYLFDGDWRCWSGDEEIDMAPYV